MLRGRATPLLLALSVVLLSVAWIIANPPSAAPDETAHYIKALGAGGGDLVGKPPPHADMATSVRTVTADLIRAGESPTTARRIAAWQWETTRLFKVPAGSFSTGFSCNGQRAALSWGCLQAGVPTPATSQYLGTYIGTYPPFVYVPAGILARTATNPQTRLWLGRAGMAAIALLMLIAATLVLWDSDTRGLSLIGLLLAVTPMVVFVSSTLSASGPEVASAICFVAALLRLTREKPASPWVWATLVVSGIVLAISRELGPEFIVLEIVGTSLVLGWRHLRRLVPGRGAAVIWAIVAAGCLVGLAWDMLYNVHPSLAIGDVISVIPSSVKQLWNLTRQEVGNFGVLDSPLPLPALLLWLGMVAGLMVVASRLAGAALAKRLALLAAGVVACTVLLEALQRQTGFSFQGRYVLPISVLVPLCAGELISRHASCLSVAASRRLVVGVTATTGLIQALAWYVNGRRVAVGNHGSWLYAFNSQWHPPLGWLPWTALVLIALAAYLAAARGGVPSTAVVGAPAAETDLLGPARGRPANWASPTWLRPGAAATPPTFESGD
jgi:hypothetical protein